MRSKKNPTLKSSKIRVGLSIGDPAGIGPAITLAALNKLRGKADFTVIGDASVLAQAAEIQKISSPSFKLIDLKNVPQKNFCFGKVGRENGRAALEYLDAALGLWEEDKIDCLVTCPISKEAVNLSAGKFSGHTEYLAQKTGCPDPVMMLLNDKIKFSLLTRHIPCPLSAARCGGKI